MDYQERALFGLPDMGSSDEADRLGKRRDFGIWQLTIKDAAKLIVKDMWYSGELPTVEEPEDWSGEEDDPKLREILNSESSRFEGYLIASIERGNLKPTSARRDFTDCLVAEEVTLDFTDLWSWLENRGYTPGDTFHDWSHDEATIHDLLAQEAAYLRAEQKRGGAKLVSKLALERGVFQFLRDDEPKTKDDAIAAYKAVVIENQQLKERLIPHEERQQTTAVRPVSTKQRDTFQVIIEALCRELGIDTQARGASQRIREITERSPVAIDDGTIKKILDNISESLQRRGKK